MARLPQPGGDSGNWGSILNDYLSQSHKPDGTIKDNAVTASALAPDSVSKSQLQSALKTELDAKLTKSVADSTYTPATDFAALRGAQPNAFSPVQFGAKGGAIDDTAAIQAAVDAAQASTNYPGGVVFLGDHTITSDIIIKRPRLTIIGGRLRGAGIRVGRQVEDGGIADLDVTIMGTTIDLGSIVPGRHGITLLRTGRVKISGVKIFNADKCVYVPAFNAFHHVRRIILDHNHFENFNYAFYGDVAPELSGAGYFGLGDITLADNFFVGALLTHFYARGLDGLVSHDNTMFFSPTLTTKLRHYDISIANWISIHDDHLFESGRESILIDHARQVNVHDNTIAWPAQAYPAAAILLTGGGVQGETLVSASICKNKIELMSSHGIEIRNPAVGNLSRVAVDGNMIIGVGSATKYIGTEPLGTSYAIITPTAGTFIHATDNVTDGYYNFTGFNGSAGEDNGVYADNLDATTSTARFEKTIGMTAGGIIDASRGYRLVRLNHTAATNVSSVTASYRGHRIVLSATTANVTLIHGVNLRLKGAVNALVPVDGIVELMQVNSAGVWVETSRNF